MVRISGVKSEGLYTYTYGEAVTVEPCHPIMLRCCGVIEGLTQPSSTSRPLRLSSSPANDAFQSSSRCDANSSHHTPSEWQCFTGAGGVCKM